jgi:hypothetical protein
MIFTSLFTTALIFCAYLPLTVCKINSNKLWKDAETKDLIGSTKAMRKLFESKLDQKDPERFQQITQRISRLVGEDLAKAVDYSNRRKFHQSAEIYQGVLEHLGTMIDPTNRRYCQDQYAEMVYRLALGGHREWNDLETILKSIDDRTAYQNYLIHFSQKNIENKNAKWKPKRNTMTGSDTLPYVLRFNLPQKYHTPTLAHYGHVRHSSLLPSLTLFTSLLLSSIRFSEILFCSQTMLDGLFPFTLAYSNNTFHRSVEHNASIYVLDIGLYLLPLLQTVYPNLHFIPFTSHSHLPQYYEPIDLMGVGFFEYTPGEEIVDPYKTLAGNQNIQTIRDVIFTQLGMEPNPQCIVLISRRLQEQNLKSFHLKHLLDESHEAPGMNEYHNTGGGMYTAFHYYATTAQERRMILNEQKVFKDLVHIFHKKYKQCVQLIQLDKLSIREQFLTFMNAKLVIGQHGAALTYSGFLSNDPLNKGILIELDPQYNWNFKLECEAMGVEYHHLQREEHPGLYKTADNVNIEISSKTLIKVVKSYLKDWKGYQEKKNKRSAGGRALREVMGSYWMTLYGQRIYNGTSALPSPESIQEREEFYRRSTAEEIKEEDLDVADNDDDDDDDDEFEDDSEDEDDEEVPRSEVCSMKNGKRVCRWQ